MADCWYTSVDLRFGKKPESKIKFGKSDPVDIPRFTLNIEKRDIIKNKKQKMTIGSPKPEPEFYIDTPEADFRFSPIKQLRYEKIPSL